MMTTPAEPEPQTLIDSVDALEYAVVFLVITHGTHDLGDAYAVRRHAIAAGGEHFIERSVRTFDTLIQARGVVPYGCACLGRADDDDDVIQEVWV